MTVGDFYLLDHPNPHGPHYYESRRGRILAGVVHITAGLEDLDATDDHSAENTARYAATTERKVSWHSGSDSDTALDLLPNGYTAFQVQGYNSVTIGHEISKRDPDWRNTREPWRTRTLELAGRHFGARCRAAGIPIRKATKAELDRAIATGGAPVGLVGHWELDEDRRNDPGRVGQLDTFPWDEFLAYARNETPGGLTVAQIDDLLDELQAINRKLDKKADRSQVGDRFGGVIKRVEVFRQHQHASNVAVLALGEAILDAVTDEHGDLMDRIELHRGHEADRYRNLSDAVEAVRELVEAPELTEDPNDPDAVTDADPAPADTPPVS